MYVNKIVALSFLLMGVFMGCKQSYPAGGPYYYKSWKTYQLPFQPVDNISIDEAKKMDAYYEAFFNANGKIQKFTKYLNGEVEFFAIYTYRPDGILERGEITKKNGEITHQLFDKNGKLTK